MESFLEHRSLVFADLPVTMHYAMCSKIKRIDIYSKTNFASNSIFIWDTFCKWFYRLLIAPVVLKIVVNLIRPSCQYILWSQRAEYSIRLELNQLFCITKWESSWCGLIYRNQVNCDYFISSMNNIIRIMGNCWNPEELLLL